MSLTTHRFLLASAGGACLAILLPVASAVLSACGDDESSGTTGQRVELATRVELAPAGNGPFTNDFGFEITLERVLISVGELRYFEGEPVGWLEPLPARTWGVRSAWAHPGHYQAGTELGEMLEPVTVDLLAAPVDLALGTGVTGEYRSAWFTFAAPPVGPDADELGDAVVLVRGEATGSDLTLRFEATARESDVLDTNDDPIVEGCPFDEQTVEGDGTVVVTIDPALWLDQVDFSRIPADETDDELVVLDPAEAPHKAFVRGLKKAAAFQFSFVRDL